MKLNINIPSPKILLKHIFIVMSLFWVAVAFVSPSVGPLLAAILNVAFAGGIYCEKTNSRGQYLQGAVDGLSLFAFAFSTDQLSLLPQDLIDRRDIARKLNHWNCLVESGEAEAQTREARDLLTSMLKRAKEEAGDE